MTEIEQVLSNWIKLAYELPGQLPEKVAPAQWVTEQFLRWWRDQAAYSLGDAESAALAIESELKRLGGWDRTDLGEAMHEMIHLQEALADLRGVLGVDLS